ncbi:MAG: transcriptional regulator [Firmicutes bacterium]|nr:transcriptional regulator [Bacillota bacterium]
MTMFFSYDESIGILTNEVNRKIVHYLTMHLESHNITPAQWVVLFRLSQQDGLSQTELAKRVNRDQPTLARILDILENKNLIERRASKEDRRSFIIFLTAKGTSLVQELAPYVESIYQKMLRGISKEHLTIYSQTLNAIKKNILAD